MRPSRSIFAALSAAALASTFSSACSTPVVAVNVVVVTTACPQALSLDLQRAPTAGVTTLHFNLTGDDLPAGGLAQDVPFANNGGSIPNVPIGKNRRITCEARVGGMVRARADSGPFDVGAGGGDLNLTLFLRVVDAFVFTGNASSSACTHLITPRAGHQMTQLADGRVLITGGYNIDAQSVLHYLSQAELYNPRDGTFVNVAGEEAYPRANHLAVPVTVSGQGSVLLLGGEGPSNGGEGPVASFELYQGGVFNSLAFPSMDTPRERAGMAVDQKTGYPVLAGGANGPEVLAGVSPSDAITYFNPTLSSMTPNPEPLAQALADAVAVGPKNTAANNIQGGIVLLGGTDVNGNASAQISGLVFNDPQHEYVPVVDFEHAPLNALPSPRVHHSAVVAGDDTIFVLGGSTVSNDSAYTHTTAAVTVVNRSQSIVGNATENLSQARADGCAVLLQTSGSQPAPILYIGGATGDSHGARSTASVDFIAPSGLSSTVRALQGPTGGGNWALQSSRHHEACLTMADGTVLVTGGLQFNGASGTVVTVGSAEIYTPPGAAATH